MGDSDINRNMDQTLISQRDAFGEAIVELGRSNPQVICLTADLAPSTKMDDFAKAFPERFINCGVAEQNMVTVAAGLSFLEFIPFIASFGVFIPGRCFDQIRVSVALNNANVKIIGSHLGFSNSGDGATAQSLEDIALMRVLPNMTVISPADGYQTKKAVFSIAKKQGPVYLRLHRNPTPLLTDKTTEFTIGKADVLKTGKDLTIIGVGPVLFEASLAQQKMASEIDLEIINCHTIKPLDEETILKSVRKTGGVVVVEEHQSFGGLGSAVAAVLAKNFPVPIEFIAVKDKFGASARTEQELLENYGLTSDFIIQAIIKVKKML